MIRRLLDPLRPYLAFAAGIALLALLGWAFRLDSLRSGYKRQLADVRAEYAAFQTRIIDRTADALRLDRARNARVAADQAIIIQEKSNAFLKSRDAELARLRERLRAASAPAGAGGGATSGVSALPSLSTGSLRPGGTAVVDVADAELCTVNTLKIEGLVAAWEGAAAVDPQSFEVEK